MKDKEKCGINKKTCAGYKDGYCVSIENCSGKEKQDYTKVQARLLATHLIECENRRKEKQIEEMAKELIIAFGWKFGRPNEFNYIAEYLVEQGYQKLLKDSVVLSKEEYDCLKRIEKAYDPFWFCSFGGCEGVCKECKDTCEMSIFVKERKKIAEEYKIAMMLSIQEMQKYLEINEEQAKLLYYHNDQIAKQFGIEIKE